MSEEELREIEARADAARPGPWEVEVIDHKTKYIGPQTGQTHEYDGGLPIVDRVFETWGRSASLDDCFFIAHARHDIPCLIAEIRRLRDQLR